MKKDKEFGEQQSTMVSGNLIIKKFEKGAIVKMKRQGELRFTPDYAGIIVMNLREFSYPKLFTSPQLDTLTKKFKDNQEVLDWVKKIKENKLTYEDYI